MEKRAWDRGIPVIYVNPAYTSKRCSRCGSFGRRFRKHFECPHCGFVANADVNAAFNIAAASLRNASGEYLAQQYHEPARISKKELRRQIRALMALQNSVPPVPVSAECPGSDNLLAVLE